MSFPRTVRHRSYFFVLSLVVLLLSEGAIFSFYFSQARDRGVTQGVPQTTTPSELGIAVSSPTGTKGGLVIPASCASSIHGSDDEYDFCSVCNTCGACNSGLSQCGGACNVAAPALLNGYGTSCNSLPNVCVVTESGTIKCDGSCSAAQPLNNTCLTFKMCRDSCDSRTLYDTRSPIIMYDNASLTNTVACYNDDPACGNVSGNVTNATIWSESGQNAVNLSGINPKQIAPISLPNSISSQTETITARYTPPVGTLQTVSMSATVLKFCSSNCTADLQSTSCAGQSIAVNDSCGHSERTTCFGTRDCDFNWHEITP